MRTIAQLRRELAKAEQGKKKVVIDEGRKALIINTQFPTHQAVIDGNLLQLQQLMAQNDILINQVDDYGITLLQYAAIGGHLEIAKYLIANAADPHYVSSWRRANGYLTHSSSIGDGHKSNRTALHDAVSNNQQLLVEYLLTLGVDTFCKEASTNLDPFEIAVNRGYSEIARCIARFAPTFFRAAIAGEVDFLENMLRQEPKIVDVMDERGNTPLAYAVYYNQPVVVELLIKYGADINQLNPLRSFSSKCNRYRYDNYQCTPLQCAIIRQHNEIAKSLVNTHHANINQKDSQTFSLLHLAVDWENYEMVAFLLQQGISIVQTTDYVRGLSRANLLPLDIALWNNEPEMVKCLLSHGAPLQSNYLKGYGNMGEDDSNHIISDYLNRVQGCERGGWDKTELKMVRYLLEADALTNCLDEWGAILLTDAIERPNPNEGGTITEMLQCLIEHGVNPCQIYKGRTFLHIAASRLSLEAIRYFISLGVNPLLTDNKNKTVLDRVEIAISEEEDYEEENENDIVIFLSRKLWDCNQLTEYKIYTFEGNVVQLQHKQNQEQIEKIDGVILLRMLRQYQLNQSNNEALKDMLAELVKLMQTRGLLGIYNRVLHQDLQRQIQLFNNQNFQKQLYSVVQRTRFTDLVIVTDNANSFWFNSSDNKQTQNLLDNNKESIEPPKKRQRQFK